MISPTGRTIQTFYIENSVTPDVIRIVLPIIVYSIPRFPSNCLLGFLHFNYFTNAPLPTTTTTSSCSPNTFPTPSHPHLPLHMLNPPPRNPLHNLPSPRPRPPFQRPRQNAPFTTTSQPLRPRRSISNIVYHHHHHYQHHRRPENNRRKTTLLSINTSPSAATCKEIHYGAA